MLYILEMISVKDNKIYDTRDFGIFTEDSLNDLRNIIINNVTDIWECYYKYALIKKAPENILYVDCYYSPFELYEVVIPEEMLEGRNKFNRNEITVEQYIQIEKENSQKIIYKKVDDIPSFIKDRYMNIPLEEKDDD